jgi:rhodanese-related sulfurtransferase
MILALSALGVIVLCAAAFFWFRRQRDRRLIEQYSVSPRQLHTLLDAATPVLIYDVRQPLDLLADSHIIPGSRRIPPKDIQANPNLIPHDQDAFVYCTCPSDETSRTILRRALALNFSRLKILKGGLEAWRAEGFPVVNYEESFRLDTLE